MNTKAAMRSADWPRLAGRRPPGRAGNFNGLQLREAGSVSDRTRFLTFRRLDRDER